MNLKFSNINKLILLYLFICFSLLIKIFFDKNGYISNDSSNYLMASQNFVDGFGFFIDHENGSYNERILFSSWPVGYPFLIGLI